MKNLHKSPGTGAPAALSTGHRHYLRHYHFHRLLVIFFRIFLLTGFLFLWEFCASHQIIDSFIFSSPSKIMNALLLMISDHSIFLHLGVTLYETFVSFFLVIFVSILFAILLWYSNNLSEILEPYLVVLNSLPKSALAPLLIVWLGATKTTIIVTGMSVAIFGSILNLYTSFRSTDPGKIKLNQHDDGARLSLGLHQQLRGSGLDFDEIRIGIVSGRVLAVNGGVESLPILEHLRAGEDCKRIVFIRVVGPFECDQHRGLIVIVVVATYRGDDFHMR